MTELTWLIALLWLVLTVFYFRVRDTMLGGTAGGIGIFFGLALVAEAGWLGFIIIMFSLYLLYTAIFSGEKKK